MASFSSRFAMAVAAASLLACGGGGGEGGGGGGGSATEGSNAASQAPATAPVRLGGTVSGLADDGLSLQFNGTEDLAIAGNGSFSFERRLTPGSTYAVTVKTQPRSQVCSVDRPSGTAGGSDVLDVRVVCGVRSFAVGGDVFGLAGPGLVLQNNAGADLAVSGDGRFVFDATVANGARYDVTVKRSPASPVPQVCSVFNGTGEIAGANVDSVSVVCAPESHTIGGTVDGFVGAGGLALRLNGGNYAAVSGTSFSFSMPLAVGSSYAVTLAEQPAYPRQACAVANGTGVVGRTDISDVVVTCAVVQMPVAVDVSGLEGSGLVLQNNGGDDLAVHADGRVAFAAGMPSNATYSVSIKSQPKVLDQSCSLMNGVGIAGGGNVPQVTCRTSPLKAAYFGVRPDGYNTPGVHPHITYGPALITPGIAPYGATAGDVLSVAILPSGKYVYGLEDAAINRFAVLDPFGVGLGGHLPVTPVAAGATSLVMDPFGRVLFKLASDGSIQSFTIAQSDGVLAPAQTVVPMGAGRSVAAADPSGRFLIVANPAANALATLRYSGDGTMTLAHQAATLPAPDSVAVDPFGKYVYVGHGGADVEVFEIDQATGGLALQQRHGTPAVAALAMHPGGKYLFAAEADGAGGTDIAVKRIDPTTGRLVDLSRAPVTGAGPVVAMAADPAGKHVHVMRETQLTTFAIDAAGALTAVNSFTMARATSIALLK